MSFKFITAMYLFLCFCRAAFITCMLVTVPFVVLMDVKVLKAMAASNNNNTSNHPKGPTSRERAKATSVVSNAVQLSEFDGFPTYIPKFAVRRDVNTGQEVSHGRFAMLGGLNGTSRVRYSRFIEALQCAPHEPGLDGNRGSVSLLRLLPPNRLTVELMCTWAESFCHPWPKCHKVRQEYNKNPPTSSGSGYTGSPSQARLLRVYNGSLFIDWPWNRKRFGYYPYHYKQLVDVLTRVSDMGDSAFFHTEEDTNPPFNLPWNFPFPGRGFAPGYNSNEMPAPWPLSYSSAYKLYQEAFGANGDSNNDTHIAGTLGKYHSKSYEEWTSRYNKGCFYGTANSMRQLVFDASMLRPDLIDARFTILGRMEDWNPSSEHDLPPAMELNYAGRDRWIAAMRADKRVMQLSQGLVGHVRAIANLSVGDDYVDYMARKYKYIVLCLGGNGGSNSGHFAQLLAHSGAVVLVQRSQFDYHFSARLKAWVHYVPLAHNTADLISKLEWLRSHEKLAYRIAQNAKAFGQSYLRLEDFFCYNAYFLRTMASIMNGTDASVPFDPAPIVDSWDQSQISGVPMTSAESLPQTKKPTTGVRSRRYRVAKQQRLAL